MLALVLAGLALPSIADDPREVIDVPGYRPETGHESAFLAALADSQVAVLPTLIRRPDRTAHSFASQDLIVSELIASGLMRAVSRSRRIDRGRLRQPAQWGVFEGSVTAITEMLQRYDPRADYVLAMEILVPEGSAVFGIEVYIFDRGGNNVFSFLLNAHHRLFAEGNLVARGSSEPARMQMIERATRVGLDALQKQIGIARDCRADSATAAGGDCG